MGASTSIDNLLAPKIPLTDVAIKNAKPKDTSYKLFDEGGLFLEIYSTNWKRVAIPVFIYYLSMNRAAEVLDEKFYRDSSGNKLGVGLKVFP